MKRIVGQILKVAVSTVLVWWLLRRIGILNVAGMLRRADPIWLLAAFWLFFASHWLGSLQWRLLLQAEDIRLPLWRTLSIYFTGLFFNNFLIGGMGGDVFRMLDVHNSSRKGTSAVSGVLLDRLMGFLVLSGISVLAVPFVLGVRRFIPSFWGGFAAMVFGWVFLLFFFFNKRFAKLFTWMFHWMIPHPAKTHMREVYRKIHAFGRQRGLFLRVLGISLVVQSARVFTHYLAGRSLGIPVPPVYYFLFIPIVAIMASLPVSIGGLGLREQTGVVLFTAVGMTAVQAVAVEFLSYLIAIASSVPGGVVFAVRGVRRHPHPHSKEG
jgi:uncharacterized protein (TIRG00374 family)